MMGRYKEMKITSLLVHCTQLTLSCPIVNKHLTAFIYVFLK